MTTYSESILAAYHGETDTVIHINEITRETTGQKLGSSLVCMDCGAQVQARIERNNPKRKQSRSRHFAHVSSSASCNHQGETYLHRRAKEVIKDAMCMSVPALVCSAGIPDSGQYFSNTEALVLFKPKQGAGRQPSAIEVIQKRTNMVFRDVILEYNTSEHSFIPDCYAITTDGQKMYIEIYVTHAVEEEKRDLLAKQGVSTLEIDLSDPIYRQIEDPEWEKRLKYAVIEQVKQKEWLFHSESPHAISRLRQFYLNQINRNNGNLIDRAHREALIYKANGIRVDRYLNRINESLTQAARSLDHTLCVSVNELLAEGIEDSDSLNRESRQLYDSQRKILYNQLVDIERHMVYKYLSDLKNGQKNVFGDFTTNQLRAFRTYILERFALLTDNGRDVEYMYGAISVVLFERDSPSHVKDSGVHPQETNQEVTVVKHADPNQVAEHQRDTYEKQTSDLLKSYGINADMSW